jgi:hypothetical protein
LLGLGLKSSQGLELKSRSALGLGFKKGNNSVLRDRNQNIQSKLQKYGIRTNDTVSTDTSITLLNVRANGAVSNDTLVLTSIKSTIRAIEIIEEKDTQITEKRFSNITVKLMDVEKTSNHREKWSLKITEKASDTIVEQRSIRGRVFLWHKDTEQTSFDPRIMSGAYYNDFKVITSSYKGCVQRIYDLKRDPYESHNLVIGDDCEMNFEKFNMGVIERIIGKDKKGRNRERVRGQCSTVLNPFSNPHLSGGVGGDIEINTCVQKYYKNLMHKIEYMFPKLRAFVLYGNKAHDIYVKKELKRATCKG